MKTKNLFFVFLVAVAIVFASAHVMATDIASDLTVKVNDDVIDSKTIGITAGETLDLGVVFKAITDENDVRVKAWVEGYRDEIEAETQRFDVVTNRTYTKKLSLAIPLDLDIKEDYKLIIRVASKNLEDQQSYQLTIQRPSYDIEILSTEFVREVKDGDNLQINVVVKNRGSHKVEDTYIKARISELGIEKRVYAGDLVAVDCEDDCDKEDAVEKTIVLEIPKGTKSGTYDLSIEAYNDDSSYVVDEKITVKGAEAAKVDVVTSELTKEVQIGGKEIYKIEIINPTDETKVITITTPAALEKAGVKVKASPSVVTIPANSAESVEVEVEATNETQTGTYTVPIELGSNEETIKEVGITANVVKVKAQPTTSLRRPLFTLAIVLGILFVVLVIVLFTTMKKPEKAGEEETAYY